MKFMSHGMILRGDDGLLLQYDAMAAVQVQMDRCGI